MGRGCWQTCHPCPELRSFAHFPATRTAGLTSFVLPPSLLAWWGLWALSSHGLTLSGGIRLACSIYPSHALTCLCPHLPAELCQSPNLPSAAPAQPRRATTKGCGHCPLHWLLTPAHHPSLLGFPGPGPLLPHPLSHDPSPFPLWDHSHAQARSPHSKPWCPVRPCPPHSLQAHPGPVQQGLSGCPTPAHFSQAPCSFLVSGLECYVHHPRMQPGPLGFPPGSPGVHVPPRGVTQLGGTFPACGVPACAPGGQCSQGGAGQAGHSGMQGVSRRETQG